MCYCSFFAILANYSGLKDKSNVESSLMVDDMTLVWLELLDSLFVLLDTLDFSLLMVES